MSPSRFPLISPSAQTRKSSTNDALRWQLQKPHIPHGGEDFYVGKKIGFAVTHVDRGSDGFEPFDEVLNFLHRGLGVGREDLAHAPLGQGGASGSRGSEQPCRLSIPSESIRRQSPQQQYKFPGRFNAGNVLDTGNPDDDTAQEMDDSPSRQPLYPRWHFTRRGEEEEEEAGRSPTFRSADKGKRKEIRSLEHEQPALEEETANDLQHVCPKPNADKNGSGASSPIKHAKAHSPGRRPARKARGDAKKENQEHHDGTRRGQRPKIKPLEYWRGERYVYGRMPNCGPVLVAPIKGVIRVPEENPVSLGKRNRVNSTSIGKKVKLRALSPLLPVANPGVEWDEAICAVIDYTTKDRVDRRIAWTANMVAPELTDEGILSHTIFSDENFLSAGQVVVPVGGRKPLKSAKDSTYIFYVIEGAVNVKIHETSMILITGGGFMIPRGNTYFIENISDREARLFFTQARKVEVNV